MNTACAPTPEPVGRPRVLVRMHPHVPAALSLFATVALAAAQAPATPAPAPAAAAPQAPARAVDPVVGLAEASNRLGAALTGELGGADKNLCFAPASLSLCLSMLLPGARGETLKELQRALCPDGADVAAAMAAMPGLRARLRLQKGELSVVHDLWPQKGMVLLKDYLATVRAAFGADVRPLDYAGNAEGARHTINDHVAKATHARIQDLLPADAVDAATVLVLTNALYFKADWQHRFAADATQDEPFHLAGGGTANVPFLHQTHAFPYAEVGGVQILRLPYVDGEFAFDVALAPAGKPVAAAEAALWGDGAAKALAALRSQPVAVALPRCRVDGQFDLLAALGRAGLSNAMSGAADYSGIAGTRLQVSRVLQKTFLQLAEEGTEAAAATAVVMKSGAAMPPASVVRFQADRPFAFALRDTKSGLILFCGRVAEPKATAAGSAKG